MTNQPPADPNWGRQPQGGQIPEEWSPRPAGTPGHDPSNVGHPPPGSQPLPRVDPHGHPHQESWGAQPETPPGSWGPQQPYPGVGYGAPTYAKQSQATTALVLSILGIVLCCGILCIPGMIMGRNEVKNIDAGLIAPSNRGTAQAAFIVGLIGTGIMAAVVLFYAFIVVLAVIGG